MATRTSCVVRTVIHEDFSMGTVSEM